MANRHSEPKPTPLYDEVMQANQAYAESFGDKGDLALPPARGFAILTCMDARLDPAKYAGLAEGDAHVIRNAGGRASDDAIRSLVISHKLLGTKEWFVIHHTDCGMELFDGPTMASLLETSRATASFDGKAWANTKAEGGSPDGWHVAWLTFKDLAQSVRDDVARTVKLAEEALADSRKAAGEMLRTPLEPLRYQRQLLENLRLLESINQELSTAMVDLANLVNAPVGQPIVIADAQVRQTADNLAEVPVQRLEEVALLNNADLREQHYNTRVAQEEVRKTMVRLFPNITFSYGMKYDSDAYLLHNQWNETGLQLSWNLMNLFTGATQKKLAEAGVKLADQRRLASQMAVVTQVHLSRLQLMNARSQLSRAEAIYNTDRQIADLMKNRQVAAAQSKLDSVSNETAAILSLLRRYQAMAQVQVAENRLMATLGMEPKIGSTQETSLQDLTRQLAAAPLPWTQIKDTAPMVQPVTVSTKW